MTAPAEGRRRYRVEFHVAVEFDVDPEAIDRVVENRNDDDVPVPYGTGQRGWRDMLYSFDDDGPERGAVRMLAWNCGIKDRLTTSLDGWADMPASTVGSIDARYELDDIYRDGVRLDAP